MRAISITKYLNERCVGVNRQEDAAYEDVSSVNGSRLRFMESYADKCIKAHLRREDITPIGQGAEGGKLVVGGWNLVYNDALKSWNGSANNIDVVAYWNTDKADLEKLLTAFDRVEKNTSAMQQPRRIVMEIGVNNDQSPWGVAHATASKISWRTDGGLIPIVAVDNPDKISNLDRVICHEITHLMEPELKDSLEAMTQLLLNDRFVNDDESSISLSGNHKEAIMAINPDYFPHQIKKWETAMSVYAGNYRDGIMTQEVYEGFSHEMTQSLAAEIISESACSRFWNLPSYPPGKERWPELEHAIFFTTAEADIAMKSPMSNRLSRYEREDYELPARKYCGHSPPLKQGFIKENYRDLRGK